MKTVNNISTKRTLKLRTHQEPAKEFALSRDKSVLAMCPGAGKTETVISIIDTILNLHPNKRVLVLTHSRNEIKDNFIKRLDGDEKKDGLQVSFTYSDDLSDASQVHICLPQNIAKIKGDYFMVVVDEAHENYLNTKGDDSLIEKDYVVQKIIKQVKPKRQVLLTGTPSKFIADGWAEKDLIFFLSINEIPAEFFAKLQVELVAIDSKWKDEYNSDMNLKSSYKVTQREVDKSLNVIIAALIDRLKTKSSAESFNTSNWKHLLNKTKVNFLFKKLGKTIFYAQGTEHADKIFNVLKNMNINCVLSHYENDPKGENIEQFYDNKFEVLVAIRRATLAYSDDELYNVVDMSGTHNINLIYQTMSRVVRGTPDMEKFYLKVTTTEAGQMELTTAYVGAALLLTDKRFLSTYNGKNFDAFTLIVDEDKANKTKKTSSGSGNGGGSINSKKTKVRFPSFAGYIDAVGVLSNVLNSLDSPASIYKLAKISEVKAKLAGYLTWDDYFHLYKKYINENNSQPKHGDLYEDVSLYSWGSNQKTQYKNSNLSEKQISLLESIDGWSWNQYDEGWNQTFKLLKEYVSKHKKMPSQNFKFKDKNIGTWCDTQRGYYKKGLLSNEEIKLLESVENWCWDKIKDSWDKNLKLLKEYVSINKCLPVQKTMFKDVKLGMWCDEKRTQYRRNNLTKERIESLESIDGWSWSQYDDLWNQNFSLLKEYVSKHKTIPSQSIIINGIRLGNWCSTQKQNYKNKVKILSKERITLLESIDGWNWNKFDDLWDKNFEGLKEYIDQYSDIPPIRTALGSWCNAQRQKYKNQQLPLTQIKKLETLSLWYWSKK